MESAVHTDAAAELAELTLRASAISESGFAVDLRKETQSWRRLVRSLGRKRAYRLMAETLCEQYRRQFGREFLFSVPCVAFEIGYHADAYFWTRGGWPTRHVSTLLFRRSVLARHCEVVDISTEDLGLWKQRLMFGYAAGVRACYRRTAADPFERLPLGLTRRKPPR